MKLKTIFFNLILFFLLFINGSQVLAQSQPQDNIPDGAVPIEFIGNHIYVKTVTDGVPGTLIFDTGAYNLSLDSLYYQNHVFPYFDLVKYRVGGAGDAMVTIDIIRDIVHFSVADTSFITRLVPIYSLKPSLGDYVDGMIGLKFFLNEVLEVNYEKEYYKTYASISEKFKDFEAAKKNGWSKIHLIKQDKKILIPVEVCVNDSIYFTKNFVLDLGSGNQVSINSPIAVEYDLVNNIEDQLVFYSNHDGIGGGAVSYTFNGASIKIGDYKINDVPMSYSKNKSGGLSVTDWAGLLGNGIYSKFNICLDFNNLDLYIQPNSSFKKPYDRYKLGFAPLYRSQTLKAWVVRGLFKDSNAEKAGLQIDDRIVKINGEDIIKLSYKEARGYFDDINHLDLDIIRAGEPMKISFDLEPMLKVK